MKNIESIYGHKFSDEFVTISISHNFFPKSKKGNGIWTFINVQINVQKWKPKTSFEKDPFFKGF